MHSTATSGVYLYFLREKFIGRNINGKCWRMYEDAAYSLRVTDSDKEAVLLDKHCPLLRRGHFQMIHATVLVIISMTALHKKFLFRVVNSFDPMQCFVEIL